MNGSGQPRRAPARVLVGVLSAQEASLPDATRAIEHQENVSPEIFHIADRPKHEANVELYGTFSRRTNEFDLLSRVDADMVIVERRLFSASAYVFERHPDVDHLIVGVDDFFAGKKIDGLHIWRGGVSWTDSPPDLFSDLGGTTARRKVKWSPQNRVLVLHAHGVGPRECARYGAHRALKFVSSRNVDRGRELARFVTFAGENPDPRRLLAVAAVEASLKNHAFGRRCIDAPHLLSEKDIGDLQARAGHPESMIEGTLRLIAGVPTKASSKSRRKLLPFRHRVGLRRAARSITEGDETVIATFEGALQHSAGIA